MLNFSVLTKSCLGVCDLQLLCGLHLKILSVLPLFIICLCLSALEEQLLFYSLKVAVSAGDGVNPHSAGRHQPDALEQQKDNCQDTTGYICSWMQVVLNNFTLCRFSHGEKAFWQVAGKSSRS